MAIEKEINLNVNSNIEGSIGQLKALKRELKGVDVGTEEFKKLYNQIDDLEDKIKSAKNKSSDWIDSLAAAGGPVGLLGESLNKAKVATQSFGGALKATGIGLVVGLVASLAAAFNDNERAQKKLQPLLNGLEKIFNGIFTVVEPLFNTLVDLAVSALPMVSNAFGVVYASVSAVFQSLGSLGSAIGKLIKGDFSGAWKDAKSSVNDFGDNYDKANKRFQDGSKELTKTEKEELAKRKEEEKKHQEELLKKQKDANLKAAEERKKALKEKQDAEKASFDAEKSIVEEQLKNTKLSIDEKRNIVLNDNKLSKADRQKFLLDLQQQEILAEENHNKAIADLNKKYDDEKLNRLADTAVKKEQLDYDKRLAEINSIAQTELEKQTLIEKLDAEHKVRLATATKTDAEKAAAEKKLITDKELADKEEAAKKEEEFQKNKDTAIALSKQNLTNIIAGLEDSGLAKTEAGQVIAKTLALTQIGIDSAVAISKASTLANAEGVAAQLAFPLVPGIGTIARIVSYASTAAGVISNISRAKQLLSSNGSSGGGSSPSSAAPSAPAAPSFNVVGNSGVNQVANVLNNQGMPPIKTYVTAGEVTTQQGLNRNIVSNATLG